MTDQFKTCSKCGEVKAVHFFRTGYRGCKSCAAIAQKKWVANNQEKEKARVKRYREKYPEKERERVKKYYEAKKDQLKAKRIGLGEAGIVARRAAVKKYTEANKDRVKERLARHRRKNRGKIREKTKANREKLVGSYLKAVIHRTTGIPEREVPDFLIEVKRKHLQILRKLKEATHDNS